MPQQQGHMESFITLATVTRHRVSRFVSVESDRPWPDHQQDVSHGRSAPGKTIFSRSCLKKFIMANCQGKMILCHLIKSQSVKCLG